MFTILLLDIPTAKFKMIDYIVNNIDNTWLIKTQSKDDKIYTLSNMNKYSLFSINNENNIIIDKKNKLIELYGNKDYIPYSQVYNDNELIYESNKNSIHESDQYNIEIISDYVTCPSIISEKIMKPKCDLKFDIWIAQKIIQDQPLLMDQDKFDLFNHHFVIYNKSNIYVYDFDLQTAKVYYNKPGFGNIKYILKVTDKIIYNDKERNYFEFYYFKTNVKEKMNDVIKETLGEHLNNLNSDYGLFFFISKFVIDVDENVYLLDCKVMNKLDRNMTKIYGMYWKLIMKNKLVENILTHDDMNCDVNDGIKCFIKKSR